MKGKRKKRKDKVRRKGRDTSESQTGLSKAETNGSFVDSGIRSPGQEYSCSFLALCYSGTQILSPWSPSCTPCNLVVYPKAGATLPPACLRTSACTVVVTQVQRDFSFPTQVSGVQKHHGVSQSVQ